MTATLRNCLSFVAVLIVCATVLGCNSGNRPPLGAVHGKITFDGKPLGGAGVHFFPVDGGKESFAVTDGEGNYTLKYIRDIRGAKVGAHVVRISTANEHSGKPDSVPARYNTNSILRKDVAAGDNVIDFALTGK